MAHMAAKQVQTIMSGRQTSSGCGHRYEVAVLLTEGRGAAPAIYRGTLSLPHDRTEN